MTYGDMMRAVRWYAYKLDSKELHAVATRYSVALRTYADYDDAEARAGMRNAEIDLAAAYKEQGQ